MISRKTFLSTIFSLVILIGCNSEKENEPIDFVSDYMFSSEIEEKVEKDTLAWKYQISAAEYATKGDYKNALAQWNIAFPGNSRGFSEEEIDSITSRYDIAPAVDHIVQESIGKQVVIINEAHHNSSHRKFTAKLLRELYDQGFRNLGLEALSNGENMDSLLQERGYPVQETGYYTKDPQFGNLIRTALDLGYTVFPYEARGGVNGELREIDQAHNIQKMIEQNPDEKFLIHCGFDHVLEGNHAGWGKAMAGRLSEFTGLDPLTIDQVIFSDRGTDDLNRPLLNALQLNEPSVLVDSHNNTFGFSKGEGWTDIAVFHPKTNYENNRPGWLFGNGKKMIKIAPERLNIDFPAMVLAFHDSEDIKTAVPVDIIEVENLNEPAFMALPNGNYIIVVTNGEESFQYEIEVE